VNEKQGPEKLPHEYFDGKAFKGEIVSRMTLDHLSQIFGVQPAHDTKILIPRT